MHSYEHIGSRYWGNITAILWYNDKNLLLNITYVKHTSYEDDNQRLSSAESSTFNDNVSTNDFPAPVSSLIISH